MQAANYHPAVGITPEPGKVHCSIGGLLQRAFSRGSVHIQSAEHLLGDKVIRTFAEMQALNASNKLGQPKKLKALASLPCSFPDIYVIPHAYHSVCPSCNS